MDDPTQPTREARAPHYTHGVAWGLMTAFALLAMLPLAGGILGWISTHAVRDPLQQVVAVTENFGIEDRLYRSHSRQLVNLFFIQPDTFDTREDYEAAVVQIRSALSAMRGSIERIAANPYIASREELLERQAIFERAMHETLATTGRRVALDDRRAELRSDIDDAAQRIADTASLAAAESRANGQASDVARRLDSLRYSASTLSMLAREGGLGSGAPDLAAVRAEFAARLRGSLNELIYLPDNDYRAELGGALESVFDLALAKGGLFDTMDDAEALRRLEAEQREDLRRYTTRTVVMLGRIASDNDRQVAASLELAQHSLRAADARMLVVAGLSTVAAILLMVVFVRGNVLRRLAGLSSVTKKLIHDDLDNPVRVEGRDELAELAAALETFRLQAIELHRKERELAARTEELEHVNRELDQFAYVASHDLKAPMRAIDTLADFLMDDLGDSVDAASRRHLELMQARVRRLSALLDSLLEYSRAGRHRVPLEQVDLHDVIAGSAGIVAPQDARIDFSGTFGTCYTARIPLEQVVRNLVDNALKHNDAAEPVISIACNVDGDVACIVIEDNGPGIPPEYHEKVFGMFQTLKARDDVEGSGMGLAILKKLADTYGGSIDVESEPEVKRGTRFIVRWPVQRDAPEDDAVDGQGSAAQA